MEMREILAWILIGIALAQPLILRHWFKDKDVIAAGYVREELRSLRSKQLTDIQTLRTSINQFEYKIEELKERYTSSNSAEWERLRDLGTEISGLKTRLTWMERGEKPKEEVKQPTQYHGWGMHHP